LSYLGFVDVSSEKFKQIAQTCIALIFPSCTELSSGAVITSKHAGLIPIVSKESGVNVDGFGSILVECSISEIKQSILEITTTSAKDLEERSIKAWEHANKHHTKEGFKEDYRNALTFILNQKDQ